MLDGLLPPLIEVAASFPNAADTLTRILDLLEAIARRGPYLALLKEYPQTLRQLARIVSSSPWAAQYLTRQPHLLDELLDTRQLMAPPDWSRARQELRQRLAGFAGDVERQMDELRHFKQSETFRLLAQDLSGHVDAGKAVRPSFRSRRPAGRRDAGTGLALARRQASPRTRPRSRSSPTASWAARNSATPPTWISSSSTTTRIRTRRKSMPGSANA